MTTPRVFDGTALEHGNKSTQQTPRLLEMCGLDSKVAIITGATSGIGRGCAEAFAAAGAIVVATGRKKAQGAKTVRLIEKNGGAANFLQQDVTNQQDWTRVVKQTVEMHGKIDVLVNNAGDSVIRPLEQLDGATMRFLIGINLNSPFLGIKAVWPFMKEAGGGVILNTNSVAGQMGTAVGSAYNASKGAQGALTKVAAIEGAPFNIRVNSVHPGFILTEGMKETLQRNSNTLQSMINSMVPTRETGRPSHIGYAMVYLASDAARYITGVECNVDGGITAA